MKNGEPRVRFIPILLNIGYNVINQCHHVPGHKYFMSITHLLEFEMERMEKKAEICGCYKSTFSDLRVLYE